jgi:hypothetical protein
MYVDIDCFYQVPAGRWRITNNSSTTPLSVSIKQAYLSVAYPPGTIVLPGMGGLGSRSVILPEGSFQANEIHRAVNYFFNVQNVFPKPSVKDGIHIMAYNTPNRPTSTTQVNGSFSPNGNYPFIKIWNNDNPDSVVIGTTLHELGHSAHYKNNINGFNNTLRGLKESFAPYVGWYLGEAYYASIGWIRPSDSSYRQNGNITRDSRQDWVRIIPKGNLGEYTPLFIDLTDNYNQRTYYFSDVPNDTIDSVPASVIWNIISTSTTWVQCRNKLEGYIGTGVGKYYTATEFENWIEDFEFWFTQSYNQGQ